MQIHNRSNIRHQEPTPKKFQFVIWHIVCHLLRFYVPGCVPFCNFWFCPVLFISSSSPLFSHLVFPSHNHIFKNQFSKNLTWSLWNDNVIQMVRVQNPILWTMQAIFDLVWVFLLQVLRVLDMDICHVVSSCSKVRNFNLLQRFIWKNCDKMHNLILRNKYI